MKFTIITICKNSEKTIRRTFESILSQSCRDYEYLVIDGASGDSTLDIIREYEPRFEGRMRWISEPDNGLYDAMNKGIRMAKGEIIGICNSDDFYEPETLQNVKTVAEKHCDIDVYYGIVRFLDSRGREKKLLRHSDLFLPETPMDHPGCFVHRDAYRKYGMFRPQFKIAADYDFLLRLHLQSARFLPMDFIESNFMESDGISSADWRKTLMDARRVQFAHALISRPVYFLLYCRYLIGRILKFLHLI